MEFSCDENSTADLLPDINNIVRKVLIRGVIDLDELSCNVCFFFQSVCDSLSLAGRIRIEGTDNKAFVVELASVKLKEVSAVRCEERSPVCRWQLKACFVGD